MWCPCGWSLPQGLWSFGRGGGVWCTSGLPPCALCGAFGAALCCGVVRGGVVGRAWAWCPCVAFCAFGACCAFRGAWLLFACGVFRVAVGRGAWPFLPPWGAARVVVQTAAHARPATRSFLKLLFISHLHFLFLDVVQEGVSRLHPVRHKQRRLLTKFFASACS